MEASSNWERVQKIERDYHAKKDPNTALELKRRYWAGLLDALPEGAVSIEPETRVLDVGCGGTSILLTLPHGRRTGVDPLMDFYLEKFTYLKDHDIRWLKQTTEEFSDDEKFDLIFSINMLDHTIDPAASAQNFSDLLAPGGRLVLLLNVHTTAFWRRYYELFYRFVDPPHPHQFHRDLVPPMFPDLKLLGQSDVDHLWLAIRGEYYKGMGRKEDDKKKLIGKFLNPFQWPVGSARYFFNRPMHRKHPSDNSLMTTICYTFAKDP